MNPVSNIIESPSIQDPRKAEWLRLDNAAHIYSAIIGSRSLTSYRICIVTKENINSYLLQSALDDILPSYPYFKMRLKYGLFWNFLQKTSTRQLVEEENNIPCREFSPGRPLFRVIYHGRRISTEFSHVLTDGIGALHFTRSLVAHYFSLKGCVFDYPEYLKKPGQNPLPQETEDAYKRYFPGNIPAPEKLSGAFHVKGKLLPKGDLNVITGTCDATSIFDICNKLNVSVNDYLTAHYLKSLYDVRGNSRKDIRVMLPVNLRTRFSSISMRNFFLTVTAQLRPSLGDYTFEEILKVVNLSVRSGINDKTLNQQLARNVGAARNPLLRIIPIFFKIPVERHLFFHTGNGPVSGIFSNLGQIQLPQPLSQHIEKVIFLTSPNHITKFSLGAAGFSNKITLTFTGLTSLNDVPRLFFRSLRGQGIVASIESNKEPLCPIVPNAVLS